MRKLAWIITFTLVVCFLRSSAFDVHAADVVDYDELFARAVADSHFTVEDELISALIHDTESFVADLAFRDADVQQAVIDKLVGYNATAEQLTTMRYLVREVQSGYAGSNPSKSEVSITAALLDALRYKDFSLPGAYRDCTVLFSEAETVSDGAAEGLGYEIAQALKGDPLAFIRTLASEEQQVQESVASLLEIHNYGMQGTVLVDILNDLKAGVDLSGDEIIVLEAILAVLDEVPELVRPTGPDPEELANRATESQPTVTEPTETEPTEIEPSSPVETEPPISEPSESEPTEPIPGDQPSIDGRWWITLCVAAAAVTIGFVCGKWYRKKQK